MSNRDERMDLGWDLLEQGEYDGAVGVAEALLEEQPDDLEAMFLAGSALFEMGRREESAGRLRRVIEVEPGNVPARLTLAAVLYEMCRFDDGLEHVERALADDAGSGYGHYYRGLLLDHKGRLAEADACFQTAARLDPRHYEVPHTMERAAFDRAIEEALELLPREFIQRLGNVPILVEDVPTPALLATLQDPAPDLLGLFVGTPLPEKSLSDVSGPPDAVYLFKRNLERTATDHEHLVEEIHVTLFHEIGHYLGLDEDDLDEAGYA